MSEGKGLLTGVILSARSSIAVAENRAFFFFFFNFQLAGVKNAFIYSLEHELNSLVGGTRLLLFVELTIGRRIHCVFLTFSKCAY